MFEWLDFVIATRNDIFIQRITLDMEWVSRNVQELACFYDSFVLPKLVMVKMSNISLLYLSLMSIPLR